jgi:hypothetical protein
MIMPRCQQPPTAGTASLFTSSAIALREPGLGHLDEDQPPAILTWSASLVRTPTIRRSHGATPAGTFATSSPVELRLKGETKNPSGFTQT